MPLLTDLCIEVLPVDDFNALKSGPEVLAACLVPKRHFLLHLPNKHIPQCRLCLTPPVCIRIY